jgi:hypothetical protein
VPARLRSPKDPMPTAVGDPAELLVVLVDERARVVVDVADRHAGQPVGIAQPAVAGAGEDRIHGRARMTGQRAQAVRAPAPLDPGPQDLRDLVGRRLAGRTMRPRAGVLEPEPAFGPISGRPTCGPLSGSRPAPPRPWQRVSRRAPLVSPAVAFRTRQDGPYDGP